MKWTEHEADCKQQAFFDVMLDQIVPPMARRDDPVVRVVSIEDRLAEMEAQIEEMES